MIALAERTLYALLPTAVRIQGRSYFSNYLLDLRDRITGTVDPNVPPRHLNISGRGSFRKFGEHNLMLCKTFGHLRPDDTVLDVGCGIGRSAWAMTGFLSGSGKYVGLDIVAFAIKWCQEHIAKRHPNFSFLHADIYNRVYNSRGEIGPDRYSFPFPPTTFTFCMAMSVFTHLLPSTTERYVAEIRRVLRPGGRFLSTWFLLDDTTETALAAGTAMVQFPHRFEHHAQNSLHAPERAVAYKRGYVERLLSNAGFVIESVSHGGWSRAPDNIDSGQDVVVARL